MGSPNCCKNNFQSGISAIECLVVAALLAIAAALSAPLDAGSARFWMFAADRDAVLAALRHARAQAVAGVCLGESCATGAAHGIHFDPQNARLIIFQGSDFASRNKNYDEAVDFENRSTRAVLSSGREIIFEANSGNTPGVSLVLQDDFGHRADIPIGESGLIDWR
jgi:Tfp pilus assembly protein FimT